MRYHLCIAAGLAILLSACQPEAPKDPVKPPVPKTSLDLPGTAASAPAQLARAEGRSSPA